MRERKDTKVCLNYVKKYLGNFGDGDENGQTCRNATNAKWKRKSFIIIRSTVL